MNYYNLPEELRKSGLFCLWKYENRNGLLTKVPYSINGSMAKSNDRNTFTSFTFALANLNKFDGLGLGLFDDIGGIDIDHCINEEGMMSELATDIMNHLNTYAELSPSKTGIHLYFRIKHGYDTEKYYQKNSANGLEIYLANQTKRFLTLTGDCISASTELAHIEDLNYILNKYMKRENNALKQAISTPNIAIWCANDPKLKNLWNGKAPGRGSNENELDLSLCCKLAYYVEGDFDKVNELFMKSPYYLSKDDYHKQKWAREDYRRNTIQKAINFVGKTLEENNKENKFYSLDDTGNAHRFVDLYGEDVLYNTDNNLFMVWNSKYWQSDVSKSVKNLVETMSELMLKEINQTYAEEIRNIDPNEVEGHEVADELAKKRDKAIKNVVYLRNKRGKENCLSETQHLLATVNDDFNKNSWLLCCDNGVVDLKTGQLKDFDRADKISQCTHCEVDMIHEPKKFLAFLKDILKNNQEIYDYLHRLFGYCITGSSREQQLYFLVGDGNDGKSLLLDVIGTVLGDYFKTAQNTLLTQEINDDKSATILAQLYSKRFVVMSELDKNTYLKENRVKDIVSGLEEIIGRYLYTNSFTFHFYGKIVISTNYKPHIRGTDKGIWRRIVAIPFFRNLQDNEVDKDLKEKLLVEAPQILGWLIKGCLEYQEKGLEPPDVIKQFTSDYRKEEDLVSQWLDECCDTTYKEAISSSKDLFNAFSEWCFNGNERKPTLSMFGTNMSKKFSKARIEGKTVYYGVKLKENAGINLKKAMLAHELSQIKADDDI